MLELVERLREQFFGEAVCREILVKNTINELWIEIYRQFSTQTVRPSDSKSAAQIQRLKNALNFIYEHYNEPITLDQMVAACCANKSEFCRLFKATLHQTPFDFLLHYRIQPGADHHRDRNDRRLLRRELLFRGLPEIHLLLPDGIPQAYPERNADLIAHIQNAPRTVQSTRGVLVVISKLQGGR